MRARPRGAAVRVQRDGQGRVILPAFAGAKGNSELVALVSDDATKLRRLGRKYHVDRLYTYEQYDLCLHEGGVDAVVIALPNTLHRPYVEASAAAGVHVLCEKPLAITEQDCTSMIESCRRAGVRLMVGYRLRRPLRQKPRRLVNVDDPTPSS